MVIGDLEISGDTARVLAPAKINLFIDVLGKRPDGYHDILTVMQAIGLYDSVTVTRCSSGIEVVCDAGDVPSGPDNVAYRAAETMLTELGSGGVRVEIEKRIPVGRGLGGGSSDAAAVIGAMNGLWETPLSAKFSDRVAADAGSDVAFFLHGSCAVCRGRGERVEPISSALGMWVVLLSPPVSVSTRRVYQEGDFARKPTESLTRVENECNTMVEGLRRGDFSAVAEAVYNGFTETVFRLYPEISKTCNTFLGHCGAGALTGTGSGFFWLCKNRREAEDLAGRIDGNVGDIYVAEALHHGGTGG